MEHWSLPGWDIDLFSDTYATQISFYVDLNTWVIKIFVCKILSQYKMSYDITVYESSFWWIDENI